MSDRPVVYVLRTLADENILIGTDGRYVTPENWRDALKLVASEHAAMAKPNNRILIGYLIPLDEE